MWKPSPSFKWLNTWTKEAAAEGRSLTGTAKTPQEAATASFAFKKRNYCWWWGFWLCGAGLLWWGQRQLCPILQRELYQELFTARKQKFSSFWSVKKTCSSLALSWLVWSWTSRVCVSNMTLWSQLSSSGVVGAANKSKKKGLKYIWNMLPWCQWPW